MQKTQVGGRGPANVRGALSLVTVGVCLVASLSVAADESSTKDFSMSKEKGGDSGKSQTLVLTGDQALAFKGGYIAPNEQIAAIVAGTREAKSLFATGDVLFVRFTRESGYTVGDRFTLYTIEHPVFHPITNALIGHLIKILGIVEITTPPVDNVSSGRVVRAFDSIVPGNPMMPFQFPPGPTDQGSAERPAVSGVIADFKESRQVTAQGDIVYIDIGTADGVAVGDWFNVIRLGRHGALNTKLPDEIFAELRVIGVRDRSATALITMSVDAVRRGDIVVRGSTRGESPVAKVEETSLAPVEPTSAPEPVRKLLADILFAFDRSSLSEQAKTSLAEAGALLKENPSGKLLITGFADERGTPEYNLALGERRAKEVQRYLTGLGLKNPMTTFSYGDEQKVCMEHNEACYSKNRRVHLALESN